MTGSRAPVDGWYAWPRVRALASAVLIALASGGCGTTYSDYEIDPGTVYDGIPLVEPLPLTVGVYYGPAFRIHESTIKRSGASWVDRYHLRLGPSSVALFDRILEAQFTEVRHVDGPPPLEAGEPQLDAVIEVAFHSVGLMSVGYDLTLYAHTGQVIAKFDVNGGVYYDNANEENVAGALRVAMRNAAARFLVDLPDHPDVHAWLMSLGLVDPLAGVSSPRPHGQPG
jgi:hypothetical protein